MTEWILSSSILILVVIGLRTTLKGKISLRIQYALWGLVLLRLLIPVNFGSTSISVSNLTVSNTPDPMQTTVNPNTQFVPNTTHEDLEQQITGNYENLGIDVEVHVDGPVNFKAIFRNSLPVIWAIGFASVAGLFLVTNARFKRKIMDSGYSLDIRKNGLDVYVTGEIDTPCLFGIRNPAIYVTHPVADDETLLRHTLEHEATHYRHGDHIWAVLRCLCLAVHWYNPLVWWAAFLSRQDGELACDEATIKRLGEGERAEYGRTLIGMTCQKKANVLITATTMNSGKHSLRERILLIAKKPKMALYTLLIVVLVAVIAVGCTFTGAKTEAEGSCAHGQILDKNGEVIVSKDLEGATTPAESTEATEIVREPPMTEIPDDAPPVNIPEMLYEQPDPDKVCIAVMPTMLSSSGEDWYYIIPENQELLLEYYQNAAAKATKLSLDHDVKRLGWKILYQDEWWWVEENGFIQCDLYGDLSIAPEDAKELFTFCRDAVQEAGIGDPVRPEYITGIVSATLYWNGVHTVTEPYILKRIETLFSNSRDYGSVQCWMDAHLELTLENGETFVLAIATDSCASWMSEGCCYSYGEETNVGIEGNEEFYSFFATDIIHEKAQDGPEAMVEFWPYMHWGLYANKYGPEDTMALLYMFEDHLLANTSDWNIYVALTSGRGLDGAYAEFYAYLLGELFEAAPATFNFTCRQMVPEEYVEKAVYHLAYHWGITPEEARAKLEAAKAD